MNLRKMNNIIRNLLILKNIILNRKTEKENDFIYRRKIQ